MIPGRMVTSSTGSRPVSLRTLFSRSLPLRYSITTRLVVMGLHSWNPASGPSVLPSPRSTRKLNCPYGRSRMTAMSASLGRVGLQPDEVVERQLDLLVRDLVGLGVEGRAGPAAGPGADEPPGIHGLAAGRRELADRDVAPVVLALDDRPTPVVQLRRPRQRPAQDDGEIAVHRPAGPVVGGRVGRERPDPGEADVAVA